MIRIPLIVIAFVIMFVVSTSLNHLFSVNYFSNTIFFVFFTMGLSDLIHSRLIRNLDPPETNGS